MKAGKFLVLIVGLWVAFIVGCATEPVDHDTDSVQDPTGTVEQGIGGFCDAWNNCYALCRRLYKCTTPAGCDNLGNCLNSCDASYPYCGGMGG